MATPSRCDGADSSPLPVTPHGSFGRLVSGRVEGTTVLYFERISCVAAPGGARPVYLQKLEPVPPWGDKSGSNRESNFRKIKQPQRLR